MKDLNAFLGIKQKLAKVWVMKIFEIPYLIIYLLMIFKQFSLLFTIHRCIAWFPRQGMLSSEKAKSKFSGT